MPRNQSFDDDAFRGHPAPVVIPLFKITSMRAGQR